MRNHRVRELLSEVIATNPAVVDVQRVDLGKGGNVLRVKFADGFEVDLLITSTSPPGGDRHGDPERVVIKSRE